MKQHSRRSTLTLFAILSVIIAAWCLPRSWQGVQFATPAIAAPAQDVLTQHNNNARTGVYLQPGLNASSFSAQSRWGLLASLPVDGTVYAQPLFVSQLAMGPSNTPHNVVFIATALNKLYAFDSDTYRLLWQTTLAPPDPTDVDTPPFNNNPAPVCSILSPGKATPQFNKAWGIISTPVIDRSTNTMFVSYRTRDARRVVHQRLAALDIRSGAVQKDVDMQVPGLPGTAPAGAGVAVEHQVSMDQMDALFVDSHGAVSVMWVVKGGRWQGPVEVTTQGIAAPGTVISLAYQSSTNQLDALFVDNHGAVNVLWTVGEGAWQGPVALTRQGTAPVGASIALEHQVSMNQLDALFVDNRGVVDVLWTVGEGVWQGPVGLTNGGIAKPGTRIALAHQASMNQLDALFVDNHGAVSVMWTVGEGAWHAPVGLTQQGVAPAGAPIALGYQASMNQLDALFVDNHGAVNVMWSVGEGAWQGPVGLTRQGVALPGTRIALEHQASMNQLDALFVDSHGAVNVLWTVGEGAWQGPVGLTQPGVAPAGGNVTLAHQVSMDQLDALFVDSHGEVNVLWTLGEGAWQGPVTLTNPPFAVIPQRQRASLLLLNGVVYISFASHCEDFGPLDSALSYHGWILAYRASSLSLVSAFDVTPNGPEGGIWEGQNGLTGDADGSVYVVTGNGDFSPARHDYSDSFLRLKLNSTLISHGLQTMVVQDSFTPYRQAWMNNIDLDLGSSGIALIPGTRLLVGGGKEGILYVLNRDHMGGYDTAHAWSDAQASTAANCNCPYVPDDPAADHVVAKFRATHNVYTDPNNAVKMDDWFRYPHIHGSPLYYDFNNGKSMLYVWGEKDYLRAYRRIGISFNPQGHGSVAAPPCCSPAFMPGGMLSLTVDPTQTGSGIIFASVPSGAVERAGPDGSLYAFDAMTLHKLWSNTSSQPYLFSKFCPPTVADGKVFLPTFSNKVFVYGTGARGASRRHISAGYAAIDRGVSRRQLYRLR